MSAGGAPLVIVPLRDGSELRITPTSVEVGATAFELSRIQDARQVAPDPETIALRVAGAGLVEFQPVRQGDGAMALEALFRLRPELRPAGFEAGAAVPPNFPPPVPPFYGPPSASGYPQPYGMPPYAPPPGYPAMPPMPQGMPPAYYPPAASGPGLLRPYPRGFGDTLGAVFQLFGERFGTWLLLGLAVAFLPAAAFGGMDVALYLFLGLNPWVGSFSMVSQQAVGSSEVPTWTLHPPTSAQIVLYATLFVVLLFVGLFLSAWQTASLSIAARDAYLGLRVKVGASLRGGLRRLLPTLGAVLLIFLIGLSCLLPTMICFGLAIFFIGSGTAASSQTTAVASLLMLLGVLLELLGGVLAVFFSVRLGLAPYIAGSQKLGPTASIRRSWQLMRGNWWRVFGVIVVMYLLMSIAGAMAGMAEFVSVALALLLIAPLFQALASPLWAITNLVLLYDLRLRHEGFSALLHESAAPPPAHT